MTKTRKILFQGFHINPTGNTTITVKNRSYRGFWVEGLFCHNPLSNTSCIQTADLQFVTIHPETLRQFSGMYDGTTWDDLAKEEKINFWNSVKEYIPNAAHTETKSLWKGRRIFEGDCFYDEALSFTGVIIFDNGAFRVEWYGKSGAMTEHGWDEDAGEIELMEITSLDEISLRAFKVIGNIFDNPGLIEGAFSGEV